MMTVETDRINNNNSKDSKTIHMHNDSRNSKAFATNAAKQAETYVSN